MISKLITAIALVVLACSMPGCVFDTTSTRTTKTSMSADITTLKNDVTRLKTEVELLKEEMDAFTRDQREDMDDLKTTVRNMEREVSTAKADILKDVDTKITALENRRIKVTNSLNTRIDDFIREVTSVLSKMKGGAVTGVSAGGTEKGFYHTVVSGESPWSIAQKYKTEYGVTTQAILDANGLEAGDPIRPGQKLFIPVNK